MKIKNFMSRLKSMLALDLKRMFCSPLYYIMLGISLVMPILILVMTTMMAGSVTTDPSTGATTTIEGFKNVWQIIGSASGDKSAMTSMDITSMCNINMMFFVIAIFVCIFVGADFTSGYCKNLFTVRAKRDDYIVSKTIVCFIAGASMLIAFFIGAMIGGGVAGLSFAIEGAGAGNVIMCMISKIFLVMLFVAIYLLACVVAKHRLWLSIILSLGIGMLFFMTIPLISPLNSGIINVVLCVFGSGIFATGIGVGSYFILKKTSIL